MPVKQVWRRVAHYRDHPEVGTLCSERPGQQLPTVGEPFDAPDPVLESFRERYRMSFSRIDGAEVESRLVVVSDMFAIRRNGGTRHKVFRRVSGKLALGQLRLRAAVTRQEPCNACSSQQKQD